MGVTDRDAGYRAILRTIRRGDVEILVGINEEDGSEVPEGSDATVAEYATSNEFGTDDGRVPARSFLRSTVDEGADAYANAMADATGRVLDGATSPERAFGRVGLRVQADVQNKIVNLREPPNAPSTVARKKSSNPLIDTGRMRQSITHQVKIGGRR